MLTVKEVARRLNVAEATVYALCARGTLAHHRIGLSGRGTIRVSEEALSAFVESCKVEGPRGRDPTPLSLRHIRLKGRGTAGG